MTPQRTVEVNSLMAQMDLDMQNYVLDMLRHIKFTQDILLKKGKVNRKENQEVEYGKTFGELYSNL